MIIDPNLESPITEYAARISYPADHGSRMAGETLLWPAESLDQARSMAAWHRRNGSTGEALQRTWTPTAWTAMAAEPDPAHGEAKPAPLWNPYAEEFEAACLCGETFSSPVRDQATERLLPPRPRGHHALIGCEPWPSPPGGGLRRCERWAETAPAVPFHLELQRCSSIDHVAGELPEAASSIGRWTPGRAWKP